MPARRAARSAGSRAIPASRTSCATPGAGSSGKPEPMKCLVLGGAGFIGSHLVEGLAQAGHEVAVFDRPREFLDPDDLGRALPGVEAIFHLISTTLPKDSNDDPAADIQSNI